jgi:hypothetical protein
LSISLRCSTVVQAPLVGPTGEGLPKVGRKNRVGDLVRQDRIEHPLARALDVHPPTVDFAGVEDEARRSAGAERRGDGRFDRAGLGPAGQFFAQPFDGQLSTPHLGRVADLFR